jgi:hypothetical protein
MELVVSGGRGEPLTTRRKPCREGESDRDKPPRKRFKYLSSGSPARSIAKGAVVTYLIVGLDRKTLTRWHVNVSADDIGTAKRIADVRATAHGIDLVVAAVIGPNSAVLSDPAEQRSAGLKAA